MDGRTPPGATRTGTRFGAAVGSTEGEISAVVCAGVATGDCVTAAIGGETEDSGFVFATGGGVICDAVSLAGLFSAKTTAGVAAAIVIFGLPVETGAFVEAASATVTFGLSPGGRARFDFGKRSLWRRAARRPRSLQPTEIIRMTPQKRYSAQANKSFGRSRPNRFLHRDCCA